MENLSLWMAAVIIQRILLSSFTLLVFLPAVEVPLVEEKEFIAIWMPGYISTSPISVWAPLNTLYVAITFLLPLPPSNLILVKCTFFYFQELDCINNVAIVPTIKTPKILQGEERESPSNKTQNLSEIYHNFVVAFQVTRRSKFILNFKNRKSHIFFFYLQQFLLTPYFLLRSIIKVFLNKKIVWSEWFFYEFWGQMIQFWIWEVNFSCPIMCIIAVAFLKSLP